MKKQEYYAQVIVKEKIRFTKVNGSVETIKTNNGNDVKIGYLKANGIWVATELTTGCSFKFPVGTQLTVCRAVMAVRANDLYKDLQSDTHVVFANDLAECVKKREGDK